ncbi:MAG: haloacid dehalogenase-like hydrolase [Rhizobiaceae bacterium]|nr:haloacid dehalogenase-like hydrolase [Rhizobiaceae bacterium]
MGGFSRRDLLKAALLASTALAIPSMAFANDVPQPLPSWNNGATKASIVDFVTAVTTEGSPDYVAPADRIATFDNDGTLWGEQPMYVQLAFALDRVKAVAANHPEWKNTEPFKSIIAGDLAGMAAAGEKGLMEVLGATHSGMSGEDFTEIATQWIGSARHPKTGRLYTEMVFQPMLELIDYLDANGFKVFIVSGGGMEFMRPWTDRVYGIPSERVVGSSIKAQYDDSGTSPVINRLAEVDFIDDGAGKPVGIYNHIGKRPIAAFGNSDGDFQMLEWTTSGPGRRFGLIVHHDDAAREYAYDRQSHFGRLDRALDAAPQRGWNVVSMKDDWKTIYPQ